MNSDRADQQLDWLMVMFFSSLSTPGATVIVHFLLPVYMRSRHDCILSASLDAVPVNSMLRGVG